MKIKERTIDNLRLYHKGHITVYFKNEETYWSFMREAKKEGYTFCGRDPIESAYNNLIGLKHGKLLVFLGIVGHIAFQCGGGYSEPYFRIDYAKYIAGDDDFYYHMPERYINAYLILI